MTDEFTPVEDPMVEELSGADDTLEVGDTEGLEEIEDVVLDPRFESVAQLIEKFDKTKDISAKTAKNLNASRNRVRELEQELAALKEGRQPEQTEHYEPQDEQVNYQPEGQLGQEYFDEEVFQRVMASNDPNWDSMKTDDVYSGQARAIMKAMMTAVGNMGVELQGMRREQQMASMGVSQEEVNQFLSIPQFSHLRGLPFEQVADVLSGIRELSGTRQKPTAPKGDGAPKAIRRDPTALGANPTTGAGASGTMQPADAINAALDAGDRDKARNIAAGLFFGGPK